MVAQMLYRKKQSNTTFFILFFAIFIYLTQFQFSALHFVEFKAQIGEVESSNSKCEKATYVGGHRNEHVLLPKGLAVGCQRSRSES